MCVEIMSTSEINPKRKRLGLNRTTVKEKDNNVTEKDKIGPLNSENFKKACLKVSCDGYQDFKKRYQLMHLPECINNMCTHSEQNVNIQQISLSAEHNFKTEFKNNTWYEALEICHMCMTPTKYLSANVLKDIVEIIMNVREDSHSDYSVTYLIRKCQNILMMHFNMHPPCVTRSIRDCYRQFLTSPMDRKVLSNRREYLSDEGIVSYCFRRLRYDLSEESRDGTLIEEQEIPSEIVGVKRLHWKKENLELFELLMRTERIERCLLVLESVIHLIQIDLALLQYRRSARSQSPILKCLVGISNISKISAISTPLCHIILELFVYCIHLQYPERYVKIMALWLNAVVQMFYVFGTYPNTEYPNLDVNNFGASFAKELYKIMSPLPHASQLRILEKIKPNFMQYLVGMNHIQTLLGTPQGDILHIIIWSVNNMSWDDYGVGERESTICKKSRLKPKRLLDYLYKTCKYFNGAIVENVYPKLLVMNNEDELSQSYIIDVLFVTFVAYLDSYSIKSFKQTLESFNKNNNHSESTTHTISKHFENRYRSIIKSLQDIFTLCKERESDQPIKKILDLINVYFS